MNILIAPDSFKGSLSADEVSRIIAENLRVPEKSNIIRLPLSDGGEGFAETLTTACGGKTISVRVKDPLGKYINASYGVFGKAPRTAVIDVASSSGLTLIEAHNRNPLFTSSEGTGMLMLHAVKHGCRRIILGLGGSATNDCGTGILKALGVRFYDKSMFEIKNINGGNLAAVASIRSDGLYPAFENTEIDIACDVDNPLCGKSGAAYVYAAQKGASETDILFLDEGMCKFAELIKNQYGKDILSLKSGGAAGGIAAGLSVFLNTEIRSGFDVVSEATRLEEKIKSCDTVITGEGRTDSQTLCGKLPTRIAETAKKYGKKCILISGSVSLSAEELKNCGFDAAYTTMKESDTVASAMENAAQRLAESSRSIDFT